MEKTIKRMRNGNRFSFLLAIMVMTAGVMGVAPNVGAQDNTRAGKRQERLNAWHKDMAEFRARSEQNRQMEALADSIAFIQGRAALLNQDFVLEADNVTFKNGSMAFVNSTTNFISVKGGRAVVQISPSNFAAGPNGVGGVTVDGMVSGQQITTDKKGCVTYSMNVMGIGINAQIEIYMYPGSNRASATIYPNFNSNTIWIEGTLVPYENANVFEGNSL